MGREKPQKARRERKCVEGGGTRGERIEDSARARSKKKNENKWRGKFLRKK